MRHRVAHRKLGRTSEHRMSLLRNLAASLIVHERIRTTVAKAKELRPFVEKLITLGKRDTLHARRRALAILPQKDVVRRLFGEVSPRFSERPGGYTRILKLGPRQGDGAEMAFIELVDFEFKEGEVAPAGKTEEKKSKKKKKAADDEAEAAASAEKADTGDDGPAEDEPPKKKRRTKKKKAEDE